MATGIVLLSLSSLLLLFFAPRSRYGLPMLLLCCGITLQSAAILFQNFNVVTYTPLLYFPLRQVDTALYSLFRALHLTMPAAQRLRAAGIAVYLCGTNAFLYVLSGNLYQNNPGKKQIGKWLFYFILMIVPVLAFVCYLPDHAFRIYLYFSSLHGDGSLQPVLFSTFQTLLDVLITVEALLPAVMLCSCFFLKRMTCFRDTFFLLLFILLITNLLFLFPILSDTFKLEYSSAIKHGFWFFPVTERLSPTASLPYPILSLITFLFTLISIKSLFGRELVFSASRRALQSSIDELNRDMKEVFHSEKNLLFSIRILTEDIADHWGTPSGYEKLQRLQELTGQRMNTISDALNRIRELHLKADPIDLRTVADNVIEHVVLPEGIRIEKEYCSFPARCVIDTYHTGSALHNLIVNSIEAMQMAGMTSGVITVRIAASRSRISLSVTDNGPGIEKNAIHRVMMPFVSTKPKTESWGIGLPYVFRVVDAQLGQMHILSSQGEHPGTTVEILLPRDRRR